MQADRALALDLYAHGVAGDMDKRRDLTPEGFQVQRIIPHSDSTASGIFLKTSGALALVFFRWQGYPKHNPRGWTHFFPTDADLSGMMRAQAWRDYVEEHNLKLRTGKG